MASPAWERRNELARARGYESYYDYRAHDYGRVAPDQPRLRGAKLRRARGHASRADMVRKLRNARNIIVTGSFRDQATGQFSQVDVAVTDRNGDINFYTLRGSQASTANLKRLQREIENANVPYFVDPSLDVFQGS